MRRVHRRQLWHALKQLNRHRRLLDIAGHAAVGVAREIEVEIDRGAPLQIAHVDAGLAQSLHRDQAHHGARPLDAGLVAAGAAVAVAPTAAAEISAFGRPFARQRAHVLGWNAGLLLLPFGRLGHAIALAHDIGLPGVEAGRVRLDVFLVVKPFLNPNIGDRQGERRRGRRLRADPFSRQELGGRVVMRIDVHDLDAELLQPLPTHRAFLRAIGTTVGFRIGRPEHHHLAVLQQILDGAVSFTLADAHRVAPVVRGAPVPAFPAVRIMMDGRVTDGIAEAVQSAEVIADMAPGMMRAVRDGHGARAMIVLHAFDLAGDQVERLRPRDADIFRLATVLRIALAVRVEVDALHRVEQTVGRIDRRPAGLPVRGERGLARRREIHSMRMNRPRLRIGFVEVDRRRADNLAVLDGDEERPAVRHVAIAHRAVRHRRAESPVRGLHLHEGLREPVGQVLRAVDAEGEILLGVDLVEPVDRRRQQGDAERGILEGERDVGLGMHPGARGDVAVANFDPAAGALVARLDLRHQIALLQARREMRMAPADVSQHQREREQNDGQFELREHRALPHPYDRCAYGPSLARRSRTGATALRGRL